MSLSLEVGRTSYWYMPPSRFYFKCDNGRMANISIWFHVDIQNPDILNRKCRSLKHGWPVSCSMKSWKCSSGVRVRGTMYKLRLRYMDDAACRTLIVDKSIIIDYYFGIMMSIKGKSVSYRQWSGNSTFKSRAIFPISDFDSNRFLSRSIEPAWHKISIGFCRTERPRSAAG